MGKHPTPDKLRDHVRAERAARHWSARRAADESRLVSNTTWSRYEAGAPLTDQMRRAVAVAFGWSDHWVDELPPLSSDVGVGGDAMRRLSDLESSVDRLAALVEWLYERERSRGGDAQAPPLAQ